MTGSWRKRNGRWEYRLRVDGDVISTSAPTKKEALERMDEKVARVRNGQPRTDAKITVGELVKQWTGKPLDARSTRRGPIKESTKRMYRDLAELYITGRTDDEHPERDIAPAAIARVRLDRLKKIHVDGLITDLRERGLAESTIRTTYHVLRLALDDAVDNNMLRANPAHKSTRPGRTDEEAEPRHLNRDELVRLLEAAKEYRYHEALALIATTGIRRGEALALKWEDVDLITGSVQVKGTLARINGELTVTPTKTQKSRRTVYLSPGLVDQLARLKDTQEAEADARKNVVIVTRYGETPGWTETGFVFTTENGQPVDPRNVFRTLQQAAKKAKLADVGLHTLRHSWASLTANSGQPLADVQELLGHTDIRTTRCYIHTDEELKRGVGTHAAGLLGL